VAEEVEMKTMQIKKKTWDRLGSLKKWPDRMNFNDVIEWLLNEQQKEKK
jgi:predicted CopG family antitoxin